MLGTIHGFHMICKDYSFLHIKAVISNLKPDLLLVESRQAELDLGNIADGPPEMLYSHLIAKSLNIPVRGIDWWLVDESKPGRTSVKRDDIIVDNIIRESAGYKKVLVIFGFSHLIEAKKRMKKQKYYNVKLKKDYKDDLFFHKEEKLIYPPETKYYIEKRIEKEKEELNECKTEKWIEVKHRMIKELENYKESLENKVENDL